MKGYHLQWKTIVGAVLVSLLLAAIFLPGMSISAEKYIDSAIAANQYAFDRDSRLKAAQEMAERYKRGGDQRFELQKDYEKKIIRNGKDSITRLFLSKWCLTADENLDFEGIEIKSGRSLGNSGIKPVLRLWGWLICFPFLSGMVIVVFMLVKGRTFSGALLYEGAVTLLCECVSHFMIPSMLWSSGKSAVSYIELISEEALDQHGTGEKFLEELFSRCGGLSFIIVSILAVLIMGYGIFCLVLWAKEQMCKSASGSGESLSEKNQVSGEGMVGEDTRRQKRTAGELRGIKGEYAGQSITIGTGEEIILGRDPKYCMLIFSSPKVSRRQCGVRYDAENTCYQIIDYSSGGTTLPDGRLLATSEYTMLFPGAVLYIAGGTEVFMLM